MLFTVGVYAHLYAQVLILQKKDIHCAIVVYACTVSSCILLFDQERLDKNQCKKFINKQWRRKNNSETCMSAPEKIEIQKRNQKPESNPMHVVQAI